MRHTPTCNGDDNGDGDGDGAGAGGGGGVIDGSGFATVGSVAPVSHPSRP
jgi:hypothetical protein